MIINIAAGKSSRRQTKKELFCNKQYEVVSRSGLNISEKRLIKALNDIPVPKKMLFLENRTGASAMIAQNLFPDSEIFIHCFDLYYANKIRRNLLSNDVSSINVICKPYIDEKDEFDLVFVQLSKGGTVNELILDILQQSHQALKKDGKCFTAIEMRDPWVNNQIKKVFGSNDKSLDCIVVQKKDKLKRVRNYQSEFEMTMHDKTPVKLTTVPGVFSHRRVDQGAQALAEVVEVEAGDTLLDMGCGCGSIGISIAKNHNLNRLCLLDSNSRAIYSVEHNCRLNEMDNYETVLSDNGIDQPEAFTLFTGNPPYFSNYKISDLFIQTAHNCLKKNGRAYIVAKTASYHYDSMLSLFGNAEIITRRGYEIVKAVK